MKYKNKENSSSGLLEVTPKRNISRGRLRIIYFRKVNCNLLTKDWIIKKYQDKNSSNIPNIIETPKFFKLQFEDKAEFWLSKEDGRIYIPNYSEYSKEEIEYQASIFLEIIRERVIGFYRKDIESSIEFIE